VDDRTRNNWHGVKCRVHLFSGSVKYSKFDNLDRVVQNVDNANHRINNYPADSVVCFVNIYPLDSDLSGG